MCCNYIAFLRAYCTSVSGFYWRHVMCLLLTVFMLESRHLGLGSLQTLVLISDLVFIDCCCSLLYIALSGS